MKIEEFMEEFFKARMADERRHQAMRVPFRRAYFTEDCLFDSHSETLNILESERVVSSKTGLNDAEVITEQQFRFRGTLKKLQHKYILVRQGKEWRIKEVALFDFDGHDPFSRQQRKVGS